MRDITKISVQEMALLVQASKLDVRAVEYKRAEANALRCYITEWMKELPLHKPAYFDWSVATFNWDSYQKHFLKII